MNTPGLSPKQVDAILDHPDARLVILSGSVRSGKTVASIFRFLDAIAGAPATGHILVVGKTLQAIERNILAPMQDVALMGPLAAHVQHTRGASTARILGRDVELIGANDARSEEKIRGLTACLAMVDEATLVPEAFWQQLGARLSVPGAKLIATTNPGGPRHWLKVNYLDRADVLDLASWHFTLEDNPALSPDYVAALKAENTGIFYARNIEGRWVAAEGAIFDFWDEARHVLPWDRTPTLVRLVAGCDYGTTNPTDLVLLGMGVDGRWYAVDEWRAPRVGLDDATQVAMIASWLARDHTPQPVQPPISAIHVDPAAASFKVALRAAALPVADAENDVLTGIAAMSTGLHEGRLRITDRCPHLLREIPSYAWDPKAAERGQDKPIKADDHCLVAGTMVVTRCGEVPIEQVRPGQMVWTRRGWRAVQDAWQVTESAPVFTLTTSDGREITGTGNHRVWVTGRGWVRMDALRHGDRLQACTPRRSAAAVHVEHVKPAGNAAVYDLTVEDAHEFFANGILVHNSMDATRYAWMAATSGTTRQHHIG